MKFQTICGIEIPEWFKQDLHNRSPDPDMNTVIAVLLEDYLKRNAPFEPPKAGTDEYFCRYAADLRDGTLKFWNHDRQEHEYPTAKEELEWYAWRRRMGL